VTIGRAHVERRDQQRESSKGYLRNRREEKRREIEKQQRGPGGVQVKIQLEDLFVGSFS